MTRPERSHVTLNVALGARSYPIHIGQGLRHRSELLAAGIGGRQVLIVTDETVAPLYLDDVKAALDGFDCHAVILPDGEEFKNLATVERLFDELIGRRFERSATLLALGGGVVGDITGFAAACYQRGVPFLQVPTTLLAQVDSSVGGKTGVNHPRGKNMIGAFHQPTTVVIDIETLATLDDRQLRAGLAEVIKYGLINDADFFTWLEQNAGRMLAREPQALAAAIERSCANKAAVVAADERELGQRALLNLGHTFGHAIEAGMGYGVWLHGEGVAAGTCMAAELSRRLGWIDDDRLRRIKALFDQVGLPVSPPAELGVQRCLELMAGDKKVEAGQLRLVLLKDIGEAVVTADYPDLLLREVLESMLEG